MRAIRAAINIGGVPVFTLGWVVAVFIHVTRVEPAIRFTVGLHPDYLV